MLCLLTLLAVALPWAVRIAICIAITTPGIAAIRTVFLLRGPRAVRSLDWTGFTPGFRLRLGTSGPPSQSELAAGCFRIGACCLLWLRAGERLHAVFIDGNRQETRAFRALCRRLRWASHDP
jgi:hypothetical protein